MPAPSTGVLQAKQRAWQYWFADGLTHLLLGFALLAISICMLYPPRPGDYGALAFWAVLLALYVGLTLWQRQILEWLKTKITYPRTGYVEPPFDALEIAGPPGMVELGLGAADQRRTEARQVLAAQRKRLGLAVALTIAAFFALRWIESRWIFTAAGVLFALAMWALRKQQSVSWITIAGLPIFGLGMTIFTDPRSDPSPHRIAWLMAGWGGLFVLEGAIALARYLRANPASKETGS